MINALNTVANYDLQIGDKKLTTDQKLDITQIVFEEKIGYTSGVRVVIRDSEELSIAFDDVRFGVPLRLSLGWLSTDPNSSCGDKQTLFVGNVVSVVPSFRSDLPSEVEVTAYDPSFKLKSPRNPSLIHGDTIYRWVIDTLERHKKAGNIQRYVVSHPQNVLQHRRATEEEAGFQFETTDFAFLSKIAERTGYMMLTRWDESEQCNTFYFVNQGYFAGEESFIFYHKPTMTDLSDSIGLLLYGFDPEMRLPGQRQEVKVIAYASIDTAGKRYGASNLGELQVGPKERNLTRVQIESTELSVVTIFGESAQSPEAAKILAEAELERRSRELIKGQATMNGWVPLRAGQRHRIILRGLKSFGTAFTGEYDIVGVQHSFKAGQGFKTKFDVSRHVVSEPA